MTQLVNLSKLVE